MPNALLRAFEPVAAAMSTTSHALSRDTRRGRTMFIASPHLVASRRSSSLHDLAVGLFSL
jgi:hypothetical protein